ncbi:hypothetical protein LTR36_009505 [Oleoguttula mirabilis]|uniref:Uncharacterized protein n=1 Tax=Oleoguttula mirabilis TaxID=1507867 RepID=A0AAV9JU76_9PEZI|nr:hypothetical protein LTR36_009505 [Oleoguttula mirabilis]
MPTCRGISLALQSQYDALTIPETLLPSAGNSKSAPSLAETGIPTYPSSQFWLSYSCQPPSAGSSGYRFYYFKLFVNGESVVSWGVGEEDNWSGKTMFGLFDGGADFEGRKVIEKRGFFFSSGRTASGLTDGGVIEVKVYRSKARRREKIGSEALGGLAPAGSAVSMSSVGRLQKGEPRRHYTYALIDPLDDPYCTFRYHPQSSAAAESRPSSSKSSSKQGSSTGASSDECADARFERRLSVPPRMQLRPSTTRYEPSSPIKNVETQPAITAASQTGSADNNAASDTARNQWVVRTPSPSQADRHRLERAGTPPSARSKNGSIGLLRGVIANALKRRDDSRSGYSA